jgi:signal peptidase I
MAKKKASKTRPRPPQKPKSEGLMVSEIYSYAKSLAIALVMALLLKHFIIEAYRIPTGSMEETILIGDFLIANKFIYGIRIPFTDLRIPLIRDPKQGDVVIFKFPVDPSQNYVKRCIAGPGQTVELRDKEVYVDGVLYKDDSFTKYSSEPAPVNKLHSDVRFKYGPFTVPDDHFFMMGDNRDHSYDSRFWGPVPRVNVLGKALFLHWSWGEDNNAPNMSLTNPASIIQGVVYNFIHFYKRVRWERLGKAVT